MKNELDPRFLALIKSMETHVDIPNDLKKIILTVVTISELEKGHILVHEGNSCNELFFLTKGLIRSYYARDNGTEVTSSFILENEFFTNVKGFITGTKSTESFEAIEKSTICRIKRTNYLELINTKPVLNPINSHIINHHRIELEERIKMLQCLTAKEKYLFFESNYPKLIQRVQLSHVASFLGVRLETLSRIRKSLLQE